MTDREKDYRVLKESVQDEIIEEKIVKQTGDVQIRRYIRGRLLGKGGFAKCYEFTCCETKKVFAAKKVSKSGLKNSRAKQKLISEIKIHKSLHHPHIVSFEHYFEDTDNVYILLEMCQNQSLNELLKRRKRLTELEVQCYLVQIIKALKYLHAHKVIHRDLKLGNLFLSDKMEVKVGDFGLATKLEFEGERKRTVCGTPNYIAPEILDGKQGHSYEVDVWSLGVICYTLIIGKPPFETQDVKTTYKKIKMNSYNFPEGAIISEPAKSLIREILVTDPWKRPSLDKILDSDFFHMGVCVPKLLPTSTLACPPSLTYIRQFIPEVSSTGIVYKSSSEICNLNDKNKFGGSTKNVISNNALNEEIFQRQAIVNYDTNKQDQIGVKFCDNFQNKEGFKHINDKIIKTASNINVPLNNLIKDQQTSNPEVWVKKWVDYSSKYGLGYLLSNTHTGVFFNDSSKIVLDPKTNNFNYIERRQSDKQEIINTYSILDYPKDLLKKVTLLQHFKNYLEGDKKIIDDDSKQEDEKNKKLCTRSFVYVKKWLRTRHALMFRLSNKIVQVCFQDHTEIILSSESRVVTYVNKKEERTTYPLSSALESNNNEMTKRLKYTKDILTHMLTINANKENKNSDNNMYTHNFNLEEKQGE